MSPATWIYSNVGVDMGVGRVGLRYPKRRNVNTATGQAAVTPKPTGLSGGPMIDTIELIKGAVRVVGVFIEQGDGVGRGEDAEVIQKALASL